MSARPARWLSSPEPGSSYTSIVTCGERTSRGLRSDPVPRAERDEVERPDQRLNAVTREIRGVLLPHQMSQQLNDPAGDAGDDHNPYGRHPTDREASDQHDE